MFGENRLKYIRDGLCFRYLIFHESSYKTHFYRYVKDKFWDECALGGVKK